MTAREPDPSRYDEHDAPAPDAPLSGAEAAASAALERVARERGLDVHRLDDEIVLCGDGQRRVLFWGLTSSSSAKLAHVVCGNDGWLRGHLARHGLPVVPTRLVGADDARFAQRAAEEIGYPLRMRLAGESDETQARAATDEGSFHEAWRALVGTAPDPRARAILERLPEGQPVDVVIVGEGIPVAGAGRSASLAARRAAQAHAAVPGVRHSSVRVWISSSDTLLGSIDLSVRERGTDVVPAEEIARAALAEGFG
jgi:hypothetical protein